MARRPDDPDPAAPCEHYEMSPKFRTWIVGQMQKEVMGQVQGAGLDRMGIVKAGTEGSGAGDGPGRD